MNQQQRILYKTKRDQKLFIKSVIGIEYIGYFRLTNMGDFVIVPRINSRHNGKYLDMNEIQEIKDFKTNEILFLDE
mgnify:CR=1 FL=1